MFLNKEQKLKEQDWDAYWKAKKLNYWEAILDFSNGKKIATTKKKYYELGGIPVSGYKNHFYTPAEAAKKMVETGHWGPWDSKPPR